MRRRGIPPAEDTSILHDGMAGPSIKDFKRETYKFFADLEFKENVNPSVKCSKCLNLLRDPIQIGCGHRQVNHDLSLLIAIVLSSAQIILLNYFFIHIISGGWWS